MVSRRRFLRLGAATAATGAAGCLGSSDRAGDADVPETGDPSPATAGDGVRKTPGDVPEWTPDWTLPFEGWQVLGLDAAADALYATLSRDGGRAAVAAVDTADETVRWRKEVEGEAVGGSHASYQRLARGGWGATLGDGVVYAVTGRADEREWTALRALDRSNGDRLWSLKRDRELAVAGVSDGLLVAAGVEFFPPADETPTSHQTPEEPLTTVVYGLDAVDGRVRWTREFRAVRDVAVGSAGVFVAAGDRLVGLGRDGETGFTVEGPRATWVEVAGERIFFLAGTGEGATLRGVAPNGDVDWRRDAPVEELRLDGDRLYAGGDAVLAVETDGTVVWRDDDYGQWLLVAPDGDTLYTRSGVHADAATAYDAAGDERWTFAPPSNDAWPEAATADALAATAITADDADDPFKTVYAVNAEGEATAALDRDTVFDAVGLDGVVYLADGRSNLLALTP